MIQKHDIPAFQSEAEEAAWWDSHRNETAAWMREAIQRRQTTTLADVLAKTRDITANVTEVPIGIDSEDMDRARVLASKEGMPLPLYVRRLLHEALEAEERKLAS